jgi:hypothetical protein
VVKYLIDTVGVNEYGTRFFTEFEEDDDNDYYSNADSYITM